MSETEEQEIKIVVEETPKIPQSLERQEKNKNRILHKGTAPTKRLGSLRVPRPIFHSALYSRHWGIQIKLDHPSNVLKVEDAFNLMKEYHFPPIGTNFLTQNQEIPIPELEKEFQEILGNFENMMRDNRLSFSIITRYFPIYTLLKNESKLKEREKRHLKLLVYTLDDKDRDISTYFEYFRRFIHFLSIISHKWGIIRKNTFNYRKSFTFKSLEEESILDGFNLFTLWYASLSSKFPESSYKEAIILESENETTTNLQALLFKIIKEFVDFWNENEKNSLNLGKPSKIRSCFCSNLATRKLKISKVIKEFLDLYKLFEIKLYPAISANTKTLDKSYSTPINSPITSPTPKI